MRTLAAGPRGVLLPGAPVDLPDKQARELVEGGYADDLAQPEAAETAAEAPAETGAAPYGEAADANPDETRAASPA
jgi:hypothetical protein